jgi:hypothetical protein
MDERREGKEGKEERRERESRKEERKERVGAGMGVCFASCLCSPTRLLFCSCAPTRLVFVFVIGCVPRNRS